MVNNNKNKQKKIIIITIIEIKRMEIIKGF